MSRLIIKNLPKTITEDKLRDHFGQKGVITDIQLKYTKEGVFRQFAFVGYQNEDEAQSALKYFNNSCIQTNRIKVEKCVPLGTEDKPKVWSKHSKESTAYKKIHGIDKIEEEEKEKQKEESKKTKKNVIDEIVGDHKNNPEFQEFMQAHTKHRTLWDNDEAMVSKDLENTEENDSTECPGKFVKIHKLKTTKNQDENYENEGNSEKEKEDDEMIDSEAALDTENQNNEEQESTEKLAEKEISDLEYMKSLKKNNNKRSEIVPKNIDKPDLFTIKIHNLPYQLKRSDIQKFFKPLKPFSIRLPTNVHGFCYVGFKTEKEFKKAMLKDKSFIKKKQVFFSDFTEKNKITKNKKHTDDEEKDENLIKNPKWLKQEENIKNEEDISESGKIFFRNLSYTTTEDDLQKIFEKYGPIAEINLPIDPLTRKIKGFGTVTFVMPEHAVTAFNELDGTTFQGRLLHLIPGKSNENQNNEDDNSSNFKTKKASILKKSANQSHNWNTLFMGANAVANVLAKRLDTTKEAIFDESGDYSAAVRLALGETEIVLEMKKFLEENDVQLNVFDSVPLKRSKTVILAKNLPDETTVAELRPLFEKFGLIGRFLLPPSGITALIEFLDPSEARKAFKKLAYSKFKNLPLYLEWAPENTFKTVYEQKSIKENGKDPDEKTTTAVEDEKEEKSKKGKKKSQKEVESEDKSATPDEDSKEENLKDKQQKPEINGNNDNDEDGDGDEENDTNEPPESDTTIFLKNLNFKTTESAIRQHFKHLGPIHMIQIAKKRNSTALGYGFIQFKKRQTAQKALKEMQFTTIEGNQIELKRSDRVLQEQVKFTPNKKAIQTKQTGTKVLVKNIPFQAKPSEVEKLFKTFGELRSVRLPKKMTPGESTHRGFGFVDFITKSDAKKAFDALCQSTHLYGRRLVLEWADITDNDVGELRKRTAEHFTGNSQIGVKKSRKAIFDLNKISDVQEEKNEE